MSLSRIRGVAVVAFALLGVLFGSAQTANAHPIHSTLTEVRRDGELVTFRIRVFADDFALAVAAHSGRAAPPDSSVNAPEVRAYLSDRFRIASERVVPTAVLPCGIQRQATVYWICLRLVAPPTGELTLQNLLLTELHSDQVNVVRLLDAANPRTMLFTARSEAAALFSR